MQIFQALLRLIQELFGPIIDDPFGGWLLKKLRRIAFLFSLPLLAFLWSVLSQYHSEIANFDSTVARGANLIFALFAICIFSTRATHLAKANDDDVEHAMGLFKFWWTCVWLMWAIAYLFGTFAALAADCHWDYIINDQIKLTTLLGFVFDISLDVVNFLFLTVYFILLKKPTIRQPVPWPIMIFFLVCIIVLEAFSDFGLIGGTRHDFFWLFLIGLMIGIISFVMMVMFVGRLDSRFLHTPTIVIICLYTYSGMQLVYSAFTPVMNYHQSFVGTKGQIMATIATSVTTNVIKVNVGTTQLFGIWQPSWISTISNNAATFGAEICASNALANIDGTQLVINLDEIDKFTYSSSSVKVDHEFKAWRFEYHTFKNVNDGIFVVACFLKALLFVFVLWLMVEEKRLEKYFEAVKNQNP
jgi:hypothetical protein